MAANAKLRVTLAQGEGENITFRERILDLRGTGTARLKRFSPRLDLAALGFATGDDLVAQLMVADNRSPGPQVVRSPSVILRWPSDLGNENTGLEGMVKKVMPAYFRSQRQVIIDAERVAEEKRKLDGERFVARSDSIAWTSASCACATASSWARKPEAGQTTADNDAETQGDGHAETHAEAPTPDEHDHAPANDKTKPGFGVDTNVLEEFGHTHDIAEAATLLDPKTRHTEARADQMWQSELHLRQGHPQQALPYAYKALGFIKEVQQATRIFLARVGPELPPIDETRRMSGDRTGLAGRALVPVTRKVGIDAAPEDAWRLLAESPGTAAGNGLPLDALERWLRANEARVPDPLAFVGAIDAVRRDPSCVECRRTLRGLLWTVLPRPPANVSRRDDDGADGRRYLEALRGEPGQ